MALDPMIARGVQPVDISNTLAQVAALRQRDRGLQQEQQQNAFVQQKYQDAEEEDDENDLKSDELNAQARAAYQSAGGGKAGEDAALPFLMQAARYNQGAAGLLAQHMRQQTQAQQEEAQRAQQQSQFDTRMKVDQSQFDANLGLRRQEMGADQAHRARQLALQEQQEKRLASASGAASASNPVGLNERQQGGMKMTSEAAISYAANLAGMSIADMEALYSKEGAAGVERVMVEKGERPVQGKAARWLASMPLGKTFVEAENADLLPQGKQGGAGIALLQNPAGMITKPDFEAGEAQFPNPSYPLKNQAQMVRSILTNAERAGGVAAAPAADPLAAHAGKVIRQGNKRFQVMKGKDGKFMAVELK
jgi:hypothetical protein